MGILGFLAQLEIVLSQFSLAFFSFFVTENVVIDITIQEMVINIAPLHTFQIKKIIQIHAANHFRVLQFPFF
jgi:hypothetical protein